MDDKLWKLRFLTRGMRGWIGLCVSLGWALVLLNMALIILIGRILDLPFHQRSDPWWWVLMLVGVFGLIFLVRAGVAWMARIVAFRTAARTRFVLHDRLYTHIQQLGPGFVGIAQTGALVSLAVNGMERLEDYFSYHLPQQILAYTVPLIILSYVAFLDPLIALVLLVVQLAIPLFLAILSRSFGRVGGRFWEAVRELSTRFLDSLQGLPTLKMFNQSRAYADQIALQSDKLRWITMNRLFITMFSLFFIEWAATLGTVAMASGMAVWRAQEGVITFGVAFAIVLLSVELAHPLRSLGESFKATAGLAGAADQMFDLLRIRPPVYETPDAVELITTVPHIRLEHVHFSYALVEQQRLHKEETPSERRRRIRAEKQAERQRIRAEKQAERQRLKAERQRLKAERKQQKEALRRQKRGEVVDLEPPVREIEAVEIEENRVDNEPTAALAGVALALADVSFEIEAGETVALVGASGAGKSSIVNLLLRFYDPQVGEILLDGHPLSSLSLDWLRTQIALVSQETYLFYGTIADNLRLARPEATLADLERVARAAQIHDFIATLPDGYHTRVGERGLSLSGGQAQRIAIARALLKDAPILILDEATSQVDSETEAAIQAALRPLTRDKTVILIAHRLSTVRNADRILVMDQGGVVESGSHSELMYQNGMYARLVEAQRVAVGMTGGKR